MDMIYLTYCNIILLAPLAPLVISEIVSGISLITIITDTNDLHYWLGLRLTVPPTPTDSDDDESRGCAGVLHCTVI